MPVAVVVADGGCYVVRVVECFEDASGINVNLSNSRIFGVGVDIEEVESVATSLICVHDSIPFVYVGLLVGKIMRFYDGWVDIVRKLQDKLSSWKSKSFSVEAGLLLSFSFLAACPSIFLSRAHRVDTRLGVSAVVVMILTSFLPLSPIMAISPYKFAELTSGCGLVMHMVFSRAALVYKFSVGIKSLLKVTAAKISLLEDMDSESAHMVAASKVPMLKPENGNSAPKTIVMKGVEKVIPPTTAEEKVTRRLQVKTRSTLMMGIPNEHQLKFNSIKDAKLLLEAI
ncbi:hypothetical protein Tco_1149382, partial [Tanacetum coccineum]